MEMGIDTNGISTVGLQERTGLGKVRHIEVCQLWLQDKVRRGHIKVMQVGTHANVADALTKYVSREIMSSHMHNTNQYFVSGRHELAPSTEC